LLLKKILQAKIFKSRESILICVCYEREIRPQFTQRKISADTRSNEVRRARDIGSSLVSACRKNGILSWDFFDDRLGKSTQILYLPKLIFQKALLKPP
jgi:hypothetical protein